MRADAQQTVDQNACGKVFKIGVARTEVFDLCAFAVRFEGDIVRPVVAFDFVAVRVLCANVVFEALAVVVAQNVAKLTLRGCGVVASRHRNASKRDDKHYGYCKYNFFHNVFIIA